MKINVIGAGPAGLYFALLMKKSDASREVTVYERNAPDSTFGWGVVFSDKTLSYLRDAQVNEGDETLRHSDLTRAASEAKLYATEAAQRIIDDALQIHGGAGLVRGAVVERLYRDVRALRIYEGTTEIQKLIVARELLKE